MIISNHTTPKRLADFYNVPFHALTQPQEKGACEKEMLELLGQSVDLIVLARYMQILGPDFVAQYLLRMINIHHSFLPAFIGAKPYHQAFERGVKLIGATSHYVTATLDEGPIIEQDVVRVTHRDTVEDMLQKGRDLERVVLSRAVRWHLENRILVYQNKTVVFRLKPVYRTRRKRILLSLLMRLTLHSPVSKKTEEAARLTRTRPRDAIAIAASGKIAKNW